RIWTGLGIVYFFWGTTYLAIDRPPPAERSPRCAGRRRAYRWVRWRRGARGWAGRGTRHRAGVAGRRRRVAIVGLWLALSADRADGRRGSRRTFRQGSAGEDRARVLLRGLRPPATTSARPAPERSVAIPPGAHPHRCRTGR